MQLPKADAGILDSGGSGSLSADALNCGLTKFELTRVPPELFLVLDRSGSMLERAAGGPKWPAVTMAIDDIVRRTQMGIFWGLELYPVDNGCGVAPTGVNIAPMLNSHAAIAGAIAQAPPGRGSTPTALAVQRAAAYLATRTTPNPKYIVLATDGLPNCAGFFGSGARDAVNAVGAAAMRGFHTYVLGIATVGGNAHQTLNEMAVRGLHPRNDPAARYYPVASRDEVVKAFEAITGQIATCSFALTTPPPAPNDVAADVDGKRVARDTTNANGWNYGPENKSIVFHGPICEQLKTGAAKNVQFIFGCPGQIIP